MSAAEINTENQAANDGKSEDQKQPEGSPQGENVDEPPQPADQNGGDIDQDSAQVTEVDKEGDAEKVKGEEKDETSKEVSDVIDDPEKPNTADGKSENPSEEQHSPTGQEEESKVDEPAMSVVISEPDKDVTTQEANAQTEGRESPVGDVAASKEKHRVVESQSESESPLVAPPTSKADRSIDSGTDKPESGGIAKDGFTANGKFNTCTLNIFLINVYKRKAKRKLVTALHLHSLYTLHSSKLNQVLFSFSVKFIIMPEGHVQSMTCSLKQSFSELRTHFASEFNQPPQVILMIFDGKVDILSYNNYNNQTCQLSRFCCESHDFLSFLTVSQQGSQSHWFWGKSF